jgi:hypothetical protein
VSDCARRPRAAAFVPFAPSAHCTACQKCTLHQNSRLPLSSSTLPGVAARPLHARAPLLRRHVLCRLARIWPPPEEDGADDDLRGGAGDAEDDAAAEKEEEDEEEGDAAELAAWLLRALAEAGSTKKKIGAVRVELLSLDVPLAAAAACLAEVCRLETLTRNPKPETLPPNVCRLAAVPTTPIP